MTTVRSAVFSVFLCCFSAAAADADLFAYDKDRPIDIQVKNVEKRGDVEVRDITFASLSGTRTPAYLVVPAQTDKRPAILFLHWYGPPEPTSNRTQFVNEAVELAKHGVISLLPATMWSEHSWFPKRNRTDDLKNSVAATKDLRRALDVLLAQPGVDAGKVALVGHDFGAMFGAVLANIDKRPRWYALLAGTGRFHHWYLYGPKMEEAARTKFIEELTVIDPVDHLVKADKASVLFQFANKDEHVPEARAKEFLAASKGPTKVLWYDAGHSLNEQAMRDRIVWLIQEMGLDAR